MAFVMAAPAAAQVGSTAIEHSGEITHNTFTAAGKLIQAVIIFICVILILIGIILLSVGWWKSGAIWFLIGAVGLGGTIWWTRNSSSFALSRPDSNYNTYAQPPPVYSQAPRAYQAATQALGKVQQAVVRRFPGRVGRGEDPESDSEEEASIVSVDETEKIVEGADCGCGGNESREDNIIVGGAIAKELFHEEMLEENLTRPDLSQKLKLKTA